MQQRPVTTGATISGSPPARAAPCEDFRAITSGQNRMPIAFADVPPFEVFGIRDRPALLLGTDLMETFRKVSLDFRARKVRFQLRQCSVQSVLVHTMSRRVTRLSTDVSEACVR